MIEYIIGLVIVIILGIILDAITENKNNTGLGSVIIFLIGLYYTVLIIGNFIGEHLTIIMK